MNRKYSKVNIRRIQSADMVAVEALLNKSISCNPEGFIQIEDASCRIIGFSDTINARGGCGMCAVVDQKIVAIIATLLTQFRDILEISKLHVEKKWQNNGIASKLLRTAIRASRICRAYEIRLHVTASQDDAIRLYKKFGFKMYDRANVSVRTKKCLREFDTLFFRLPLFDAMKHGMES